MKSDKFITVNPVRCAFPSFLRFLNYASLSLVALAGPSFSTCAIVESESLFPHPFRPNQYLSLIVSYVQDEADFQSVGRSKDARRFVVYQTRQRREDNCHFLPHIRAMIISC